MSALEHKTILVADDDPDMLTMVVDALQSLGAAITQVSDGQKALDEALKSKPHLMVLDVMMPHMSGWEVCRAVREEESLENTKVLMLTGIGERLNDLTSPLYGADDHLDKPFDINALCDKARSLLSE